MIYALYLVHIKFNKQNKDNHQTSVEYLTGSVEDAAEFAFNLTV